MEIFNIVCFSINNWEKRKARKQQFMLYLSERNDVERVLYIEPPINFLRSFFSIFLKKRNSEFRSRFKRSLSLKIESLSDKLFLFTPVFFIPFSFRIQIIYNLNLYITFLILKFKIKRAGFNNTILWLYHPFDYSLLSWFKKRILSIFDWAEEWSEYFIEFKERKREKIRLLQEKIIKSVDIVFVVSKYLLERAKILNENSYQILDGTVYEIFQKKSDYIPEDIRDIKRPILGYLGAINERIDTELLEFISKEIPQANIVLIGDIHHQRIDISKLKRFKNIFLLGGKEYEDLGSYTRYFDVFILPYKPELTLSLPTKIFDYLATGKPIVSTDLAQINLLRDYIYMADSKEEFVGLVKKALNEENPQLSNMRSEVAMNNTWEKRAEQIMDIVKKMISYGGGLGIQNL